MKRLLVVLIALVAVCALALPASAADLKFGGYFHQKFYSTDNQHNGDDDVDDNTNWFYTRMRLYFTAVGSENLMAVSKFEIDDFWGNDRIGTLSADGGSNNDDAGLEIKNAYIDFTVPDTALNFKVGIIGAKLDKAAWVFNDDTSGIFANYKADQLYVAALYSRLGDDNDIGPGGAITPTGSDDDVDIWAAAVNYTMEGIFLAANIAWVKNRDSFGGTDNVGDDFNLYVFSLDADYSADLFSVYGDVAFNAGKNEQVAEESKFKGYAVMAGGTFNATDVITVGADFYFASGQETDEDDTKAFITAGAPTGRNAYFMDETVFPGWFDDDTATINTGLGVANANNIGSTGFGTNAGYCLNNIIAFGLHGDFKPLEKTFVQVGGAYMMFHEDVDSDGDGDGDEDKLGSSIYLRASQGIVDGLTLKFAAGYLFADDGFTPNNNDDDAYRIATGLFWSW